MSQTKHNPKILDTKKTPNPSPQEAESHSRSHPRFMKGVVFILISAFIMSLQNIITRVILSKQTILGIWETGNFISPSLGNSILILVIRMLIALPVLAFVVSPKIYKNTWIDIKNLTLSENQNKLIISLASGCLLFVSSFSIYLALGSIPTGVATTIFFIYPTVTILILWIFFQEKPPISLVFAMITIYLGGFLTIPEASFTSKGGNVLFGAVSAAISGATFAGYVIMVRLAKMHPAPFSIINFTIILILGSAILPFFDFEIPKESFAELVVGCILLATTTLFGYLLNNFGVPIIGPALTSVIGASGPAVTAILALGLINEKLSLHQIIGVFLVTIWVIGISVENMKKQTSSYPKAN